MKLSKIYGMVCKPIVLWASFAVLVIAILMFFRSSIFPDSRVKLSDGIGSELFVDVYQPSIGLSGGIDRVRLVSGSSLFPIDTVYLPYLTNVWIRSNKNEIQFEYPHPFERILETEHGDSLTVRSVYNLPEFARKFVETTGTSVSNRRFPIEYENFLKEKGFINVVVEN